MLTGRADPFRARPPAQDRGSPAAWVIGFLMGASTVLSMFLFVAGGPMNTADTWLVATCVAQVAVLCTPPLFGFVRSREKPA